MVQIRIFRTWWGGSEDMSHQPVHKSDANKMWRHARSGKSRHIAPEYHLIVTAGTKTEPHYSEGLRNEINSKYPGRIAIKIEGVV